MINLSAFIQFVGALYLTIAIDSILFKRFWNPDFFAMMSENIKHYTEDKGVNISSELNNKLTGSAKEISDQIDKHSRWQGCMMLIYSVALLVAFGFKEDFVGDQVNTASFCLLAFVVLGLLSFLLSKWLLRSWGSAFVIPAVVMVLPFLAFAPFISRYLSVVAAPIVWLKISVVFFLLLPIAWRILYNWLYSSVYSVFIHTKIKEEYNTYLETKKYLKNKQSEMIVDRYKSVLTEFFNKEGIQDTGNKCAEIYVDLITEQCDKIPGVIELWKHRNDKFDDDVNNLDNDEEKETVQPLGNQTPVSKEVYERLFVIFEKLKGTKKLQAFCEENKVNYEQFREYRKKRLKEIK